jgi:hypothetical protein
MTTIETTANVGSDGVLRLEVPIGQAGQALKIVLVITPQLPVPTQSALACEDDPWREYRAKLAGVEGITLPPPVRREYRRVEPIDLPGPSASEILIRDRR